MSDIIEFASVVEPPERMHGLEVPDAVVEALGAGRRPRVQVTLNGHSWITRIAIMRGRNLIGLSKANRAASKVETGQPVTVGIEVVPELTSIDVPQDVQAALDAAPNAARHFESLTLSQRRQHIRVIDQAKSADTRARRIAKLVETLGG